MSSILIRREPLKPDSTFDETVMVYSSNLNSKPNALLTIAIPTYQRPELLAEALESCRRQSLSNFRVIVIDNDSTTDYVRRVDSVVQQSGLVDITLYRNRINYGMFGNWNKCFTLCQTPFVTILNDDDLLAEDYVSCVTELISVFPEADMVQSGYCILDHRIERDTCTTDRWNGINFDYKSIVKALNLRELSLANKRAGCLGITYRVEFALEVGGFNPIEYPTADYCFNARMLANGAQGYEVACRLAVYRISENESLKPATLIGFIANDYFLRRESAPWFRLPIFMRLYAYFTVSTQYHSLRRVWLADIPASELKRLIGVKPIRLTLLVRVFKVINMALRRVLLL